MIRQGSLDTIPGWFPGSLSELRCNIVSKILIQSVPKDKVREGVCLRKKSKSWGPFKNRKLSANLLDCFGLITSRQSLSGKQFAANCCHKLSAQQSVWQRNVCDLEQPKWRILFIFIEDGGEQKRNQILGKKLNESLFKRRWRSQKEISSVSSKKENKRFVFRIF